MLLNDFGLYSPETDEDYEMSRDAHTAMRHYIQACTSVKDLEGVDFPNFYRAWGTKYRAIGAADTAAQEAVWFQAERYLALRELLDIAGSDYASSRKHELKQLVPNVRTYFGIEDARRFNGV